MNHYDPKVCPILLCQREDSGQILVFRHPLAATQLIKGTLEPGERPEVAALRELAEESGLTQAIVVAKIGELAVPESEQQWHLYLCQPAVDPPEQWANFTTDGVGLTFQFFWQGLADELDESWHSHFRRALNFIRSWRNRTI